jgi:hypothetical protein
MSYSCFNLISVTGPQEDVLKFRNDALRPLSAKLKRQLRLRAIEFSIETLFQLHQLPDPYNGLPGDEGEYYASFDGVEEWRGFSRAKYTLSLKNNEIHELFLPISRCYPALCFVNSQLDDNGSIVSTFTKRGRQARWELPEERLEAYWKAAAKRHRIKNMEKAYDDAVCREGAEGCGLAEALNQWDDRVVLALKRVRRN